MASFALSARRSASYSFARNAFVTIGTVDGMPAEPEPLPEQTQPGNATPSPETVVGPSSHVTVPQKIAVWGSSSAKNIVERVPDRLRLPMYNGAVSPQWSAEMASKANGYQIIVTMSGGVVPHTGPVMTMSAFGSENLGRQKTEVTSSLAGVPEVLCRRPLPVSFERRSAGPLLTVADAISFEAADAPFAVDAVVLLNIGKRDAASYQADTIRNTAAMAEHYSRLSVPVLVIEHFRNANMAMRTRSRASLDAVNDDYQVRYWYYVHTQGLLSNGEIWSRTGITPTAADLAAQFGGTLPPLLDDGSGNHLNAWVHGRCTRCRRSNGYARMGLSTRRSRPRRCGTDPARASRSIAGQERTP